VHAEDNLYTCSQDSIQHITEQALSLGLNRVVVASCTPLTHEQLFQEASRQAGLNPGMFQMANIRNQCSWVHPDAWDAATEKARDLVRMAVAKALRLEPLRKTEVEVEKAVLVVGGGVAGMTAALTLADQGFPVHLVEREERLGGNLWNVRMLAGWQDRTVSSFKASGFRLGDADVAGSGLPGRRQPGCGRTETLDLKPETGLVWRDPRAFLQQLVDRVEGHPRITVHLRSEFLESSGFAGNFTSRLRGPTPPQPPPGGATLPQPPPPGGGEERDHPNHRSG
jgi:hypothetical protein